MEGAELLSYPSRPRAIADSERAVRHGRQGIWIQGQDGVRIRFRSEDSPPPTEQALGAGIRDPSGTLPLILGNYGRQGGHP